MSKTAARRTRLVLGTAYPICGKGLRTVLSSKAGFAVVGESQNEKELVRRVGEVSPDLVLIDIGLPGMAGRATLRRLRRSAPERKIIILKEPADEDQVLNALEAGADGCFGKGASPENLIRFIGVVLQGGGFACGCRRGSSPKRLARRSRQAGERPLHSGITAREREVLVLIANGLSNRAIAGKLRLSVRTIETHREHLMDKLNIHTIAGLTKYALFNGLIHA